jgi:AAHS family 3-hydroxyphenylpropionic acid transporter
LTERAVVPGAGAAEPRLNIVTRTNSSTSSQRSTLILCVAAALFEGFDNQSMGVAAPRLIPEFALTAVQTSWVFTAATIGLFIGAVVGGRLSDLIGRRQVLIGSMLVMGVCSLWTAMAGDLTTLVLARFMTGLGLGGAMPNFIALSAEAVEPSQRVRTVTAVTAALPLGGALAGLIALSQGLLGWDWRVIFYVGGLGPIVLALVMIPVLRESRVIERAAASATAGAPVPAMSTALFGDSRASTTLQLWLGFFFAQMVLLLMLNWLPTLFVGLHFSQAQASWASILFNVSGAFVGMLLARKCVGAERRMWIMLTYGGIAVSLLLLPTASTFAVAAIACALAGATIIGAQLILYASAPLYYDKVIRGTGVGAAVGIGRLGSVFGPLYGGVVLAFAGASTAVLIGTIPFVLIGGGATLALARQPHAA